MGYPAPGADKNFNQLNHILKVQSLWSCAHYFQWFTVYLSNLCWLTHVTCSYMFKENALLFNVHLGCFVDFILCPTGKYMFKVNNKKISLICWMCLKLKINKAWHSSSVFIDLDRHGISAYQYNVSTFHFEQVFVGKVWKTSHKRYIFS